MPTLAEVLELLKSPKVQETERAALSASGVVGAHLIHWGFPQVYIGPLTETVIYILPFLVAYGWSLATKTHNAIIQKAAELIAAGKSNAAADAAIVSAVGKAVPGASVSVNPAQASPAVTAVAAGPDPGVNLKP